MKMPHDSIVVSAMAGNKASLTFTGSDLTVAKLSSLGFLSSNGEFVRPVTSETDRIELVRKLIELHALFEGGPDWSPAEVVGYLKDQGKLSDPYNEIVWKNPDEYTIREHA